MQFISTEDGLIPASRIITIDDQDSRVEYEGDTGPRTTRLFGSPEHFEGTIIQAAPGYYALSLAADPNRTIVKAPVVAWRVIHNAAQPITPQGRVDNPSAAVQCPDGTVVSHAQQHSSESDWRDYAMDLDRRTDEIAAIDGDASSN